jgi:hypothetical protein
MATRAQVKQVCGTSTVRRTVPFRRLHFELLEDRQLLAGLPQLVQDINTKPAVDFTLVGRTEVAGKYFFADDTPTMGAELWMSDAIGRHA